MKKVLSFDFDYSKEDDVLTIFDYSKPIKETIEFSEILNVYRKKWRNSWIRNI